MAQHLLVKGMIAIPPFSIDWHTEALETGDPLSLNESSPTTTTTAALPLLSAKPYLDEIADPGPKTQTIFLASCIAPDAEPSLSYCDYLQIPALDCRCLRWQRRVGLRFMRRR